MVSLCEKISVWDFHFFFVLGYFSKQGEEKFKKKKIILEESNCVQPNAKSLLSFSLSMPSQKIEKLGVLASAKGVGKGGPPLGTRGLEINAFLQVLNILSPSEVNRNFMVISQEILAC